MKTKKSPLVLTLLFSILTVIAIGVGILMAYLQSHLSVLFSNDALTAMKNALAFQEKGTIALVGAIAFYALLVFGLISLIVAIAKKKGGYILPIFTLVAACFALLFLMDSTASNNDFKTLDYVFAAICVCFALVDAILPLCYQGKKAAPVAVATPVEPAKKEAKSEENKPEEKKLESSEPEKEEKVTPVTEEKPEEKKDEQSTEEKSVEEKPAEEKQAEEKPVEEKPAKEKPAPKKVAKKAKKEPVEEETKPVEEPVKQDAVTEEAPKETAPEAPAAPVEEAPKEATPTTKNAEAIVTPSAAPDANKRAMGKYEVYPEAGFFKYRLKANNGEILIVSNGYKTRDGAKKGIDTLQKNIANGVTKITTDKKGFAQFRIFTGNDSRLIVAGEIYPNAMGAQSALNSVQKFYRTDKIVDLDEIPEAEIREWRITLPEVEASDKGKFEIFADPETGKYRGRLLANNGQVLFLTSTYVSKNGVLSAFEKIQKKLATNDLTVTCDKQGRFQFMVYADNGSVLVMGETYPNRDRAVSAATSAKRFAAKATIIGNK